MVVRTVPTKTADAKTFRMMQVRMQKDNANAIERFENAAMDRRVQVGLVCRVQGSGFRVQGSGLRNDCRVWGSRMTLR